jgi:hypothetical protein
VIQANLSAKQKDLQGCCQAGVSSNSKCSRTDTISVFKMYNFTVGVVMQCDVSSGDNCFGRLDKEGMYTKQSMMSKWSGSKD